MPGIKDRKDPFGFNQAFPTAPPEAKEYEPDPDCVPQPGVLKDPRFNRDPEAGRKRGNRHGAINRVYVYPEQSAQLESRRPIPEMSASAPRAPTSHSPSTHISSVAVSSPYRSLEATIGVREAAISGALPTQNSLRACPKPHLDSSETPKAGLSPKAYVPPHLRQRTSPASTKEGRVVTATSPPSPGDIFSISEDTASVRSGYGESVCSSVGRRASAFTNGETLVDGKARDDADLALMLQLEEFHVDDKQAGLTLEEHVLKQSKIGTVKTTVGRAGEAYTRYCKMREIIWKRDELEKAYPGHKRSLNAMDNETFEGYYALIRSQHENWWKDRHRKAEQIRAMEEELRTPEHCRYTVQEMLDMDIAGLDHHHAKVFSAYRQYLEVERGGSRLAAFTAEEPKMFGDLTPSEELAMAMKPKLRGTDFYDTDNGSDCNANCDSDNEDDDECDGPVVYKGYRRA